MPISLSPWRNGSVQMGWRYLNYMQVSAISWPLQKNSCTSSDIAARSRLHNASINALPLHLLNVLLLCRKSVAVIKMTFPPVICSCIINDISCLQVIWICEMESLSLLKLLVSRNVRFQLRRTKCCTTQEWAIGWRKKHCHNQQEFGKILVQ